MENRCIVCGEIIPEGIQICRKCMYAGTTDIYENQMIPKSSCIETINKLIAEEERIRSAINGKSKNSKELSRDLTLRIGAMKTIRDRISELPAAYERRR